METQQFLFKDVPQMLRSDNVAVRMLARSLPTDAEEIAIEDDDSENGQFSVIYRIDRYRFIQSYDARFENYHLTVMSSYNEALAFDLGEFSISAETGPWVRSLIGA